MVLMLAGVALAQTTQPVTVQATEVKNITSTATVIDNRPLTRQNNGHSFVVTGSGSWSVQIQYADAASSGPWTSFPDTIALVTNTSISPIGGAYGYHAFIRFNITGTVSVNYAGQKAIYVPTSFATGGGVSSVGISMPSVFVVTNSPILNSGTLTVNFATGQISHEVLGTCGSATVVSLCSLVVGDLPTGYLYSNLSGAPTIYYQTVGANSVSQTQRGRINLIQGTNVTITASDNSGTGSTDITISSTGGGGGGLFTSYQFGSNTAITGSNIYLQTTYPGIFTTTQTGSGSSGSPFINAIGLATQTQNTVFAAPNGSTGNPTFRSLVLADIPTGYPYGNLSGAPLFQVNGVSLVSSATINFQNASAPFNGITFNFSNPSLGNIQVGATGTLNNSGLTNSTIGFIVPSWLTMTSSASLGTTATLGYASGQASHQVIGTCGTATSFSPCSLVAGDIPPIPISGLSGLGSGVAAALAAAVSGSGSLCMSVGSLCGTGNKAALDAPTTGTSMTFTGNSSTQGTQDTVIPTAVLTANVITSTCTGFTPYQHVTFIFTQDGTGGRTVASCTGWDAFTISGSPNAITTLAFTIDASGNGHQDNSSSDAASIIIMPTARVLPSAPTSGIVCVPDSTSGDLRCINSSGTIYRAQKELSSGNVRCAGGSNTDDAACTPTQLSTAGATIDIASGTAALGTSSISSGSCATVVTATATGALSTDTIIWTPNASIKAVTGYAPSSSGGLSIAAYPTSGNVNFDVCNWSGGSITPGAVTLNWRVAR